MHHLGQTIFSTMKETGVWPQDLSYSQCSDGKQNELETINQKIPNVDLLKYIKMVNKFAYL